MDTIYKSLIKLIFETKFKRRTATRLAILLLGITLLIIGALTQRFNFTPIIAHNFTLGPTPAPSITINLVIKDEKGNVIPNPRESAPYNIQLNGTVINAENLFVYLIVDDGYAQFVQPGLGQNTSRDFAGSSYLGIESDSRSLNKLYKIFAVVTDKKYKEYDVLEQSTIKARSNIIEALRTH